jgi:hypothetical protein
MNAGHRIGLRVYQFDIKSDVNVYFVVKVDTERFITQFIIRLEKDKKVRFFMGIEMTLLINNIFNISPLILNIKDFSRVQL